MNQILAYSRFFLGKFEKSSHSERPAASQINESYLALPFRSRLPDSLGSHQIIHLFGKSFNSGLKVAGLITKEWTDN